ncbi:MAG TPA: hypothetical protein DD381_00300 [Lentisphaeria bacterium]|nr:MAG: hypothetical protein A2X47_06025 [Lentisphaerae bacterium GWF2_38_69]HBM14782.1 hypothetical protein [Lentisphaeria bacterium]
MNKKNKIRLLFVIVITAVVCVYFFFHGWVIAYTDDAYIRANISVVTPRVNGHILNIYVKTNEFVKKGTLLMDLDPYPYELRLNVQKAALSQTQDELKSLNIKYETVKKDLISTQEEYKLSLINAERNEKLLKENAVSKINFEMTVATLDRAKAKLIDAKAECNYTENELNAKQIEIESMQAKLALAQYELDQTKIYAPADGYITNFNVMPGDYAGSGQQMFVIIQDDYWWVMANYKESILRHITKGQTVYIHSDMYPYRLFKGTVTDIGRGTSRTKEPNKVLPYIEPTTDWIRLQRRFSVRIDFEDLPKDVRLAEGSDASTYIMLL